MRKTSGIIINDDIFINANHVVKMEKSKVSNGEHVINIYLSVATSASPIKLTFNSENDRNVIFNKIVMELYGHDYAHVDF